MKALALTLALFLAPALTPVSKLPAPVPAVSVQPTTTSTTAAPVTTTTTTTVDESSKVPEPTYAEPQDPTQPVVRNPEPGAPCFVDKNEYLDEWDRTGEAPDPVFCPIS